MAAPPTETNKEKELPRPSYARRFAIWSFRETSREFRLRSDEEIAADKLFNLPLRFAAASLDLLILGALVMTVGIILPLYRKADPGLPNFLTALAGLVLILMAPVCWAAARYMLRLALETRAIASETQIANTVNYRDVENVRAEREQHEQRLFYRNMGPAIYLHSFGWNGVRFFEDGRYDFAPRVNVLLGKNGYGKTLLLRTLAAVIQRNLEYSAYLFPGGGASGSRSKRPEPRLIVSLTRDGNLEKIIRDPTYFEDAVGKIPLLAIPDARFVNRSVTTVASSPTGSEPLAAAGAKNYLTQEPYENVVTEFLYQIAIDYLESPLRGFDLPIFSLIQEVVRNLTEDDQFAFANIRRTGRTGFEILVRTAGSRDTPLPIQAASQGTFSVIAIFGLIYSFLRSLRPGGSHTDVLTTPGIVIIDEIDAHLHPSWQLKILGLLTGKFPNVQFFVSAHSPAIVAGCDFGEVAVLRRNKQTDRFWVDPGDGRDYLGVSSPEIYRKLFEVDDVDRLYLEYATKATMDDGSERAREIERLAAKTRRSASEEERLHMLERDDRLVRRAAEVRDQRLRQEETNAYIDQLKQRIAELELELERLRPDSKRQTEASTKSTQWKL